MNNRFEVKYLIEYSRGIDFINELRFFMKVDPKSLQPPYLVSSLYFDTVDFKNYEAVLNGEKKREKVRLRKYSPESQDGFFEIKYKNNRSISKDRIFGKISNFYDFIDCPTSRTLPPHMQDYYYFLTINNYLSTVTVNYQRIALVDLIGEKNRVTLDFNIRCGTKELFFGRPSPQDLRVLPPDLAIIELKFYEKIPKWLKKVVTKFKLNPTNYSKYINSMDRIYKKKEIISELY